jgi:hypothetical protein
MLPAKTTIGPRRPVSHSPFTRLSRGRNGMFLLAPLVDVSGAGRTTSVLHSYFDLWTVGTPEP